ncbi:membrane protein insertase YidC [Salinisphaera sp. USBA-960]|nr:membrane protein insertase YidC [Salifodinibacter halophilus]NNC27079.1 membrane protein insertase YidC [Salifodinibacter halophilus]
MENLRFILLAIAALFGVLLYQAWQTDYPGNADKTKQANQQQTQNRQAKNQSQVAPGQKAESGSKSDLGQKAKTATKSVAADKLIHVVTNNYRIAINPHGGNLYRTTLRNVPLSSDQPDTPLTLLQPGDSDFFRQSSRVIGGDTAQSNVRTFKAAKSTYRLGDNQDTLKVPLAWHGPNGRTIKKTFVFKRDTYRIDLDTKVQNGDGAPWEVSNLVRFWRHGGVTKTHPWFIPSTFSGVGWYAAGSNGDDFSYHKRETAKLGQKPVNITQTGGWAAVMERYFLAAAIPDQKTRARFFASQKATDSAPDAFTTGFRTAQVNVAPGDSTQFNSRLFVGPKLQNDLASVAPGLDLTVDYGFMTVLARPIFKLLSFLHSVVGNWGVAIILLTLIIKLLFYKLSEKQFRSMARMRKFQPRMQQIKEQYGDDRQQMQAKMMELYKKEGFNPLAGCWPMLVQAPVFIVLYWVLLESAEMRAAPFLWINDLSSADPFFILPIIFGVTMFIQQRLTTSTAMDPLQQRMMQIMPLGLAVFFTFFPAGLVLYWCTNNTLSIAQQWYIYKKLDNEGLGHKASNN